MVASELTGPVAVGATCLTIVVLVRLTLRPLRRRELCARLWEILSLAMRKSLPLAPAVADAAKQAMRRDRKLLNRAAERLETGSSVADAVAGIAAPHELAMLRGAREGTGTIRVLDSFASDRDRCTELRNRLRALLGYALVVTICMLVLLDWAVLRTFLPRWGSSAGLAGFTPWTIALLLLGVLGLVWSREHLPGWLAAARRAVIGIGPGRRLFELPALERAFRAAAVNLEVGGDLPDGLRRAAVASGDRRVMTAFRQTAEDIEHGLPVKSAWIATPLPAFAVRRLVAIDRRGDAFVRVFGEIADGCARRHDELAARAIRWLTPIVLLALAALIALHMQGTYGMWLRTLAEFSG